jgi:type IV secretion system protein VirB3
MTTQDRNPGLVTDPLFVAVTRHAMRWGVPYPALLACGIAAVESFLITRNLVWLLVYVPLHALCYLMCLREPCIFDLVALWGRTRGPGLFGNVRYWHANSYSPLCIDLPGKRARRRAAPTVVVVAH